MVLVGSVFLKQTFEKSLISEKQKKMNPTRTAFRNIERQEYIRLIRFENTCLIKISSPMFKESVMYINQESSLSAARHFLSVLCFILIWGLTNTFSQGYNQSNYYTQNQPNRNYMANSTAFKQEIARMEINVVRGGRQPMPITQVPRLQKDDVLKVRMLEEEIGGLKPDQSNWDWTFLAAFVNPGRNNNQADAVSQEINFRKTGWYREYSFTVPYDSQPIFFLYPKPNYRSKILKLIGKKYDEIKKVGEKTIDIAGAYAQIGMFLNELQGVLYRNNNGGYGSYRSNGYNNFGGNFGYNYNQFTEQTVERLARSFNIQLPSCWQGGYGNYNNYNSYGNYGGGQQDLVGRVQCVAKNIRLEDFDLSVSRLLQQGGILAVAQLQQKYPQIAHWIGVAAIAIDFIIKIAKKSPLKIVPTVLSSLDNQRQTYNYQNAYSTNFTSTSSISAVQNDSVKISVYAENQPNDGEFVTAYPIVTHKWQAEPDPEIISLPVPSLLDSCLHTGQNILRNTDLTGDWVSDSFTKNFKLVVSSSNGFRKDFPLKKNLGMSGWELNITKEDLNSVPKIKLNLEAEVVATRGFNEIRSPKFELPMDVGGTWEVAPQSASEFAAGAKRVVTLKNQFGSCRCLQTIVYRPSFGGQFIFEANAKENALLFSEDGKEVSFEIYTTNFQSGPGQLELKQYGGDTTTVNLNLYQALPNISELKIAKGDKQALIIGERLEQLQYLKINGKKAVFAEKTSTKNQFANIKNNYSTGLTERVAVFEDATARQTSVSVLLELGLENNRIYHYLQTFSTSAARPAIVTNQKGEVEAVALQQRVSNKPAQSRPAFPFMLPSSVFPIETSEITLNVQNTLTDYDFKTENIRIEARIENAQINPGDLPKINFEVLDWKNLKISFRLSQELQRFLGGKRLLFRIRDRIRGDSDWYPINKTFVRTPENISVNCAKQSKDKCELKGVGIEYISQISVDGGKTWFPESPATLTVEPTAEGLQKTMIPRFSNRSLVRIRLRDFPQPDGLVIPGDKK